MENVGTIQGSNSTQLVLFNIENFLCGIDISLVQEINRNLEITVVHHAPDFVKGVVNLRGKIVTIIDLRKKMGFSELKDKSNLCIVVVMWESETVGLLVDNSDDIMSIDDSAILPAPKNINKPISNFLEGVYSIDDSLISILSIERLLQ